MTESLDYEQMARALQLARRGVGNTDPNPAVGCVIAQGERIVGEGWTAPAGGPHAERVALAAAGNAARGASVHVTLEPCAHVGRTGPCTDALIAAGVARVVYAVADPNHLVEGGGGEKLRAAGIAVEQGPLQQQAININRGFFSRMQRGRPWVQLKLAASLDGATSLANGQSQWLTGEAARADVHRWRARASAIMTGVGTVLADDPSLTARPDQAHGPFGQPARLILDSNLRTPVTARTLALEGRVLILSRTAQSAAADAVRDRGADIIAVGGEDHCDLAAAMQALAQQEFNTVWVEAGSVLSGALLEAGLVDELFIYMAPKLLGSAATGMFGMAELESLDQAIGLQFDDVRRIGADLRIRARLRTVAAP